MTFFLLFVFNLFHRLYCSTQKKHANKNQVVMNSGCPSKSVVKTTSVHFFIEQAKITLPTYCSCYSLHVSKQSPLFTCMQKHQHFYGGVTPAAKQALMHPPQTGGQISGSLAAN